MGCEIHCPNCGRLLREGDVGDFKGCPDCGSPQIIVLRYKDELEWWEKLKVRRHTQARARYDPRP